MKKKPIIIGIVLILTLLVIYLNPSISTTGKAYNCRICGAIKSKRTTKFLFIPIWISWDKQFDNEYTKIYKENIGIEHEHQWAGGGYWGTINYLFYGKLHKDGAHLVEPYPVFQSHLTRTALKAIDQVKDWPKEKKLELHDSIINIKEQQDYIRIRDISNKYNLDKHFNITDSNNINPNKVWSEYLQMLDISK